MFEIVLFQPRIPANTGNIIRLCANTGSNLHLIPPLGFSLDDAQVRRAGLDYREMARVTVHRDLADARTQLAGRRWIATTARQGVRPDHLELQAGDVFLFGPEPTGLDDSVLAEFPTRVRLPMVAGNRSLNLSNAVAVLVFEAWRQIGYAGSGSAGSGSAGSGSAGSG